MYHTRYSTAPITTHSTDTVTKRKNSLGVSTAKVNAWEAIKLANMREVCVDST